MPAKKIVIYTTDYCPYCRAAKEFLTSKRLAFEEIDVSDNDALRQKLIEKTGQETVPQIFVDGKSIGGYDELTRLYRSGKSL